jgi:hypothetical protein
MKREVSAERKHRRFYVDPRFGVGMVLVVGSVVGVALIVAQADATTEVLVAGDTIVAGDAISASDLSIAHVRLGTAVDLYLRPGTIPPEGILAVRSITAGELVPMASLGALAGATSASVVVSVDGPLAQSIHVSSRVTLWASLPASEGARGFDAPAALVPDATVVQIIESTGLIAAGSGVQVELLLPRERLAAVLAAMANGAALAIVADDQPVVP